MLFQIVGQMRAFHCGASRGEWKRGGLHPRQQHRRVEFLVGRWREPMGAAPLEWIVRFWQCVIWMRQVSLLLITRVASFCLYQLGALGTDDHAHTAYQAYRRSVLWTALGLSILVLLSFFAAQRRFRPFAHGAQNSLESFLLVTSVMVLLLGGAYDYVTSSLLDSAALQTTIEVVLMATLVGGLLSAVLLAVRDARRHRNMDVDEALAAIEARIDGRLRARLADGTVQLVRCSWLLSAEADASLGRGPSGEVLMVRRQELPAAAFFSPAEAAALLDRHDRSVLALSYRWLTGTHPGEE